MDQFKKLLSPCVELVTYMLKTHGYLSVFGYALRHDERGRGYISDDGDVEALLDTLRVAYARGEFEWIVFVDGVSIRDEAGHGHAVVYYVGGPAGLNKRIFVRYMLEDGQVTYQTSQVTGLGRVIKRARPRLLRDEWHRGSFLRSCRIEWRRHGTA